MSITIRIDDDVEAYICQHGKFGESHSDVLRRLLPGFVYQEPPVGENGSRNRYVLFGQYVCAIIRWMGKDGWKFAEVRQVLDSYELQKVNDTTIRCQLQWEQRGAPADLSADQAEELRGAASCNNTLAKGETGFSTAVID